MTDRPTDQPTERRAHREGALPITSTFLGCGEVWFSRQLDNQHGRSKVRGWADRSQPATGQKRSVSFVCKMWQNQAKHLFRFVRYAPKIPHLYAATFQQVYRKANIMHTTRIFVNVLLCLGVCFPRLRQEQPLSRWSRVPPHLQGSPSKCIGVSQHTYHVNRAYITVVLYTKIVSLEYMYSVSSPT